MDEGSPKLSFGLIGGILSKAFGDSATRNFGAPGLDEPE
jgi:hypothetical protein